MVMTDRLHTVLEEQDSMQEGQPWRFWTAPQRLTGVSYDDAGVPYRPVRRRGDGQPYTPRWQAGEPMLIYCASVERVIALLRLDGPAHWNEATGLFWTESTVELFAPDDGPTLADIGVDQAVQGGRQPLTPAQYGAAVKALREFPVAQVQPDRGSGCRARDRELAEVHAHARERVDAPCCGRPALSHRTATAVGCGLTRHSPSSGVPGSKASQRAGEWSQRLPRLSGASTRHSAVWQALARGFRRQLRRR